VNSQPIVIEEENVSIDLKDRLTAALLAWLVPGLGHLYQGRTAKAILFFVCIVGTFVYGCYLGSNERVGYARVVYASFRSGDHRWAYLCQVGVGLPALPAMVQAIRARSGSAWGTFMAPPRLATDTLNPPSLDRIEKELKGASDFFELGTVYTMIAGLLNVLAIWDAWGGPVLPEKKPDEDESAEEDADDSAK